MFALCLLALLVGSLIAGDSLFALFPKPRG
jgi:hypothetical protein